MIDYPDSCIRGLRSQRYLTNDGHIATAAFVPDFRTAERREDGGSETSINWEDDDNVLDFTLQNRTLAEHGAAHLPRDAIDYQNTQPGSANALSYERDPLEGNPYHGNIIFQAGLPRTVVNMIAGALALASTAFTRDG